MSINTLVKNIKRLANPTVIGLDARIEHIPAFIVNNNITQYGNTLKAYSQSILEFNTSIIDAVCDIAPAVKLQSAYYELLGPDGAYALEKTMEYAASKGMYVIADVKRNDIGSTAQAYSEAYLGQVDIHGQILRPYPADSVTVNAYLGTDGITPFTDLCKRFKKSMFVLVKTSNPSSGEFQNRIIDGGNPLFIEVAHMIDKWSDGLDTECGYNEIGAVVGATYPGEQSIIRKLLKKSYFLVPGYGAQGASAKDIINCFNDDGLGAIINSSRGIMCAWQKKGTRGENFAQCARDAAIDMRNDIVANIK